MNNQIRYQNMRSMSRLAGASVACYSYRSAYMSGPMKQQSTASHEDLAVLATALERVDRELSEGRERYRLLRAQESELVGQLKSERERASDLAWELEDLEQRMRDLAEQRGGPIDPLLERELTSIAGQRTALEERLL